MNLQGQDWETVVFKKRKQNDNDKTTQRHQPATQSERLGRPAHVVERLVDESKLPRVTEADAKLVIQGRTALKLTRQDLAKALNMKVQEIEDIENKKAFENKQILAKIKQHFVRQQSIPKP